MEHQETHTDIMRRIIEVSRILAEAITPEELEAMYQDQGVLAVQSRNVEALQKQLLEEKRL